MHIVIGYYMNILMPAEPENTKALKLKAAEIDRPLKTKKHIGSFDDMLACTANAANALPDTPLKKMNQKNDFQIKPAKSGEDPDAAGTTSIGTGNSDVINTSSLKGQQANENAGEIISPNILIADTDPKENISEINLLPDVTDNQERVIGKVHILYLNHDADKAEDTFNTDGGLNIAKMIKAGASGALTEEIAEKMTNNMFQQAVKGPESVNDAVKIEVDVLIDETANAPDLPDESVIKGDYDKPKIPFITDKSGSSEHKLSNADLRQKTEDNAIRQLLKDDQQMQAGNIFKAGKPVMQKEIETLYGSVQQGESLGIEQNRDMTAGDVHKNPDPVIFNTGHGQSSEGLSVSQRVSEPSEVIRVGDHNFVITKKDQTTIEVSVEPEGFGKLNIELNLERGVINARIDASDAAGKELLEKNLHNIINSLTRDGLNIGGFSISLRDNKNENHSNEMNGDFEEKRLINDAVSYVSNAVTNQNIISIFV